MLRDKAIPLYYQLETILRRKILSGELAPGSALSSEDALAEEYQVSRITVRQSLAALEKDELIIRRRGKGTFISQKIDQRQYTRFTGSIDDIIAMGIQTSTVVRGTEWIEPPPAVDAKLNLKGAQALRIEKVRWIEKCPFSHVFNYLPADIGRQVPLDKLSRVPLLMILEDDLKIRAATAQQVMAATIADAQLAELLQIRVGDPLLRAERTVFDAAQRPVEYVSVCYRADKYAFSVNLRRKRTKEKTGWDLS